MESRTLFFIAVALIAGIIIGFSIPKLTRNASLTCPNYNCEFVDRNASYEPVGSQTCSGQKGLIFGSDECTIQLRNTEKEQSASYVVSFHCKTIDSEVDKTSSEVTLAPSQVGDFKIKFNEAGSLDWKCEVKSVIGSAVKGCQLVQK